MGVKMDATSMLLFSILLDQAIRQIFDQINNMTESEIKAAIAEETIKKNDLMKIIRSHKEK